MAELGMQGVTVQELKYSASHVSVYRGMFYDQIAAIKVLPWREGTNYTEMEKECATMLSLSHPNILKLLSCFWVKSEGKNYYIIVTEWCEKDLEKDIQQRAQHTFPFTEPDLLALCSQMIAALAFLQAQGLAHRDIKPQNIFLTKEKTVKIGDFGSASGSSSEFGYIVGTPYYLSPILKQAMATRQVQVQHNAFKSDVYSLGLTILGAAKLDTTTLIQGGVTPTDEVMAQKIAYIQFPEVKALLMTMLGYDEANRSDFLQLREWAGNRPWGSALLPNAADTLPQYEPIPSQIEAPAAPAWPGAAPYGPLPQAPIPVSAGYESQPQVVAPIYSPPLQDPMPRPSYYENPPQVPVPIASFYDPSPEVPINAAFPYDYQAQTPISVGFHYDSPAQAVDPSYNLPPQEPIPAYDYPNQAPVPSVLIEPIPVTSSYGYPVPAPTPVVSPYNSPPQPPTSSAFSPPAVPSTYNPPSQPIPVASSSVPNAPFPAASPSNADFQAPIPVASNPGRPKLAPAILPSPLCLHCDHPVDRKTLKSPAIQLYCQPDLHMYCSPYCFSLSCRGKQQPICPRCNTDIAPELTAYLKAQDFPVCVQCNLPINAKSESEKGRLPHPGCGKHFCCSQECLEQLKSVCPLCPQIVQIEEESDPLLEKKRGKKGCWDSFEKGIKKWLCCWKGRGKEKSGN